MRCRRCSSGKSGLPSTLDAIEDEIQIVDGIRDRTLLLRFGEISVFSTGDMLNGGFHIAQRSSLLKRDSVPCKPLGQGRLTGSGEPDLPGP